MQTEIILLTRLDKLGELGDIVKVNCGYARNYLVPYGKAKLATPENIEEFKLRKDELQKATAEELHLAEQRKEKIDGLDLEIKVKLNEKGIMFGSVDVAEIIGAIKERCGEEVKKNELHLPDGAFRELGEYDTSLKLHPDVRALVKLRIVVEES